MDVKEIAYGSADYQLTLLLRERVLRAPLGMTLSPEDTRGEAQQRHFGCFRASELIACVVAKPTSDGAQAKLRQMAVADACRGGGVGRQLLYEVETLLRRQGIHTVELSARRVAEGFYRKLGYAAVGEPYIDLGIEHIRMTKRL